MKNKILLNIQKKDFKKIYIFISNKYLIKILKDIRITYEHSYIRITYDSKKYFLNYGSMNNLKDNYFNISDYEIIDYNQIIRVSKLKKILNEENEENIHKYIK